MRYRPRTRRWLKCAASVGATAICLLATACGGGDNSSSDNGDTGDDRGGNPGTTIRGGERIGWDQSVDSPIEARGFMFLVYVDGAPRPLTEVQCSDERSANGVACSARLPAMSSGRHTLEMTASINGSESQRSQPIVVSVVNGLQTYISGNTSAPPIPPAAAETTSSESACVATYECYRQHEIASGLGVITAPLNIGNRLFFVENGRAVRTLLDDSLQAEVALSVGSDSRITGLAAAPDFDRTHRVYVGWTEMSSGGQETLNITRYRELSGVLAEGATIVAGLPLPPDSFAPIAIDDAGLLYVALPAMQYGAVGPPADLSNYVLRFAADGAVPDSNPTTSPVLALGYGRPAALVWDRVSRQLWMSGTDVLPDPVTVIPVDEMRAEWPWIPRRASANVFAVPSRAMSLTSGSVTEPRFLWLSAVDRMIRLRLDRNEVTAGFGQTGLAGSSLVVDGPGDSLYIFGRVTPEGSFKIMRWDRIPNVSLLRRR